MIISIFLPHGGCPERCTFCDQRVSGGVFVAPGHITSHIHKHLQTHQNSKTKTKGTIEVAFYGGTFTALSRELQVRLLEEVRPFLERAEVDSVRISTRPDAVDSDWMRTLRDRYAARVVELGVQSFNPEVLSALGRTHSIEAVHHAVATLRSLDLQVGLHFMVGCPGEAAWSEEIARFETHLEALQGHGVSFARIHPLLIVKGTALDRSGWRKTLPLDIAIERCADLLEVCERLQIRVIRIGLQPNEVLTTEVVAGPYHPAFGERVRSCVIGRQLAEGIRKVAREKPFEITILEKIAHVVYGHESAVLERLKKEFQVSEIPVDVVRSLPNGSKFEIRIRHPFRSAKRGQVEPSQSAHQL